MVEPTSLAPAATTLPPHSYSDEWRARLHRALAACALAVVVGLAVACVLYIRAGALDIHIGDFAPYYSAGQLVAHGHGGAIYTHSRLWSIETPIMGSKRPPGGLLPYLYPPWFAMLMAAFATLSYDSAFALWTALGVAMTVGCLLLLARRFVTSRASVILVVCMGLSFLPVISGYSEGQVSALLFTVLTVAFLALADGRERLGGIALAFVLLKPQYVPFFLLFLLIQRRWRALGALLATSAVLAALSTAVFGPSIWTGYFGQLQVMAGMHNRHGYTPPSGTYSLFGPSYILASGRVAEGLYLLSATLLTLGLAWALYRTRRLELAFALTTLVALLASPHVNLHDLTIVLLPALIVAGMIGVPRTLRLWPVAIYLGVILAIPFVPALPLATVPLLLVLTIGLMWQGFTPRLAAPGERDHVAVPLLAQPGGASR